MSVPAETAAYRDDVRDASAAAWHAIGELRDYVLAVKSCIGTSSTSAGSLPIPEDHERITTKLAAVNATVSQLLAFVAQRAPEHGVTP